MGWGRILFFYECNIISLIDFKWTIVRLIVTIVIKQSYKSSIKSYASNAYFLYSCVFLILLELSFYRCLMKLLYLRCKAFATIER